MLLVVMSGNPWPKHQEAGKFRLLHRQKLPSRSQAYVSRGKAMTLNQFSTEAASLEDVIA
jgi:hypothetical protein